MADEENTPPDPPRGREADLGSGGSPQGTPVTTLGGTPGRRQPNAPRGRPQPINLQVARDPNILANPGWQNEICCRMEEWGLWMYNTVRKYVEWTHMMRVFVPNANVE